MARTILLLAGLLLLVACQSSAKPERLLEKIEDARGRELVHEWVAKHPMRGPLFGRPSTAADMSRLTRKTGFGTLGAVRRMEEHLAAIAERMSLYVEHLPRQARWS